MKKRFNQQITMFVKAILCLCPCAISLFSFAQTDYIQKTIKLPMSNEAKSYYVKQVGTNYILNGDIIVGNTLQQLAIYQSNNSDGAFIWPKGNIPVKIDGNMKSNKTIYGALLYDNALEAIKALNNYTNLRLVPYNNEKDYIRIKYTIDTGYGGISPIGKKGGEQVIYITRQSGIETIVHEMLHSLGFWHEQSRYDRDQYVFIDTSNINKEYKHNFQIEPGTPQGGYDYESIMHYRADAFAIDPSKPTIKCRNGNTVSNCSFGSNYIFSTKDIAGINTAYWFNKDVAKRDYLSILQLYDPPVVASHLPTKVSSAVIRAKDQVDITDGIYKIKINQTGKYLAVENVSTANGAKLVQWDYFDQANHQFKIIKNATGYYEIIALHSNKHISMAGGGKADGTQIFQWDCNGDDYCKWTIFYSTQRPVPGWVIQGKSASAIQMAQGISNNANGQSFILKQQQRQDAHDYDAVQTFTFEKIRAINQTQPERINRSGSFDQSIQKIKRN